MGSLSEYWLPGLLVLLYCTDYLLGPLCSLWISLCLGAVLFALFQVFPMFSSSFNLVLFQLWIVVSLVFSGLVDSSLVPLWWYVLGLSPCVAIHCHALFLIWCDVDSWLVRFSSCSSDILLGHVTLHMCRRQLLVITWIFCCSPVPVWIG